MHEIIPACRAPVFAALLLATAGPAVARPAFFWTLTEGTFLRFEHLDMQPSTFGGGQGESAGKRATTTAQYDFSHAQGWVAGVGHEYSDLDIADAIATPQANGHLHTLHLATQWSMSLAAGEFRLAAAPAISVSSNALKNPDSLGRDSLQVWGAALYTRRQGSAGLVLGVARDNRFGEARVYPVAGLGRSSATACVGDPSTRTTRFRYQQCRTRTGHADDATHRRRTVLPVPT